jgi:RNA polymerase sigma-70 factor (ECF subfamily)
MTDKGYLISELAEKAKSGDRASLGQLIDVFYEDIYRVVYCRVNSKVDAEDLTQDIFMQMVKKIKGLRDANCFRTWLFRIALNHIRDFQRKKRWAFWEGKTEENEDDKEIADNHDNPENLMMQKEFWRRFNHFTKTLASLEQEVFILRFIDNLKIVEISEVLEKSESTIKTCLYRALKKFKHSQELGDFYKEVSG